METLHFFLVVGVLLYSVYSLVAYASRRGKNKRAFSKVDDLPPVREATAEELAAVQPFLIDPAKRNKPVPLKGPQVYRLSGPFVRHGISYQSNETLHDTLGGVDVTLPFDARAFLSEDNEAEVLLTERHAIVIKLNGAFDIIEGRDREQSQQAELNKWMRGDKGRFDTGPDESVVIDETAAGLDASDLAVEILGQRDETPDEIAARTSPGLGILATVFLVSGAVVALIGAAGEGEDLVLWGGIGLVLMALGLWFGWRRARVPAPEKVNRARGLLTVITVSSPDNASVSSAQMFLGQSVPLTLPEHWLGAPEMKRSDPLDVDVRVNDHAVLRLGRRLSIGDEQRRHPVVYWGRHMMLALAGGVVLAIAWFGPDRDPAEDLAQTTEWLRSGGTVSAYESGQALLDAPPHAGQIISVSGQGRCHVGAARDSEAPVIDCSRLHMDGSLMTLPELTQSAALQAARDGRMISAKNSAVADAMVRMEMLRRGMSGAYYQVPRFLMVSHLERLIPDVSALCDAATDITVRTRCVALETRLSQDLFDDVPWADLVAQVKAGDTQNPDGTALASEADVSAWRRLLGDVVSAILAADMAPHVDALIRSQTGGVIVRDLAGEAYSRAEDWGARWDELRTLSSDEGLRPVALTGMVTAVAHEEATPLVLTLSSARGVELMPAVMARTGLAALGALLLLVHGLMFLRRLQQAGARKRALARLGEGRASGLA